MGDCNSRPGLGDGNYEKCRRAKLHENAQKNNYITWESPKKQLYYIKNQKNNYITYSDRRLNCRIQDDS